MASGSHVEPSQERKIGIIGSGLIGRSWAMLFASAGYSVSLYDAEPDQLTGAKSGIKSQLLELEKADLLRGKLSVQQQYELISTVSSLEDCVVGAKYVQECVPEKLELKREIFSQLDKYAADNTILASSTSCIPSSKFSQELKHRGQVIVAHPTNPPMFCPLTEVVPSPHTSEWVTSSTLAILKEIGQVPVLLKKEITGFALNRIQYALLSECWRLIEDGAISVEDVDKCMTDGLGMRYAFMGPFQTCHLNAEGFLNYCDRYGETINNVVTDFGPSPTFAGPTVEKITSQLTAVVPLEELASRRQWRDQRLAELSKLKKRLEKDS